MLMEHLGQKVHQEPEKEDRNVGEILRKRGARYGACSVLMGMGAMLRDEVPEGEEQREGEGSMGKAVPGRIRIRCRSSRILAGRHFSVTAGEEGKSSGNEPEHPVWSLHGTEDIPDVTLSGCLS